MRPVAYTLATWSVSWGVSGRRHARCPNCWINLRRQASSAPTGLHPRRVGRSLVAVIDRASAAARYSPARVVPTFWVSALFVKPSASVSGSNCNAGLLLSLRTARTVLLYSTRVRRRSGARPVTSGAEGVPIPAPDAATEAPLRPPPLPAPGPMGGAPLPLPAAAPAPCLLSPAAPLHAGPPTAKQPHSNQALTLPPPASTTRH